MFGRRRHGLRASTWNDACNDGTDSTTQCNGNDFAGIKKKKEKDEELLKMI